MWIVCENFMSRRHVWRDIRKKLGSGSAHCTSQPDSSVPWSYFSWEPKQVGKYYTNVWRWKLFSFKRWILPMTVLPHNVGKSCRISWRTIIQNVISQFSYFRQTSCFKMETMYLCGFKLSHVVIIAHSSTQTSAFVIIDTPQINFSIFLWICVVIMTITTKIYFCSNFKSLYYFSLHPSKYCAERRFQFGSSSRRHKELLAGGKYVTTCT